MDRSEKVVLTNMCMVYDGSKILVENRVKKDWPGVTFPGGHVEHGESIVDSTVREVKEETGLDIKDLKICGVKQFFDDDIRTIVFCLKQIILLVNYNLVVKAKFSGLNARI